MAGTITDTRAIRRFDFRLQTSGFGPDVRSRYTHCCFPFPQAAMRIHPIQKPSESRPESPAGLDASLDARTLSLVIIATGVVIFLLQQMQALFAPLAFGVLLFYALDPIVDILE